MGLLLWESLFLVGAATLVGLGLGLLVHLEMADGFRLPFPDWILEQYREFGLPEVLYGRLGEEVFFALEATYPWGVGLGLEGSLGGLGVGAQVWYRDGFALQLGLSGEEWRAWGVALGAGS